MYLNYSVQLQKYLFIKLNIKHIIIMTEAQNWNILTLHIVSIVSSVSARKLKCPSSARLGTFTARLSLSRKIQAQTHY